MFHPAASERLQHSSQPVVWIPISILLGSASTVFLFQVATITASVNCSSSHVLPMSATQMTQKEHFAHLFQSYHLPQYRPITKDLITLARTYMCTSRGLVPCLMSCKQWWHPLGHTQSLFSHPVLVAALPEAFYCLINNEWYWFCPLECVVDGASSTHSSSAACPQATSPRHSQV